MLQEILMVLSQKHFLFICNHWMEQTRSCHLECWKFGILLALPSNLLDAPQEVILTVILTVRQVAQLHQRLSRLQEHKFNLNFQDSINLLCGFGMNIESNSHFFSPLSIISWQKNHSPKHPQQTWFQLIVSFRENLLYLNAFILSTERFKEPLL